ncbi:MAG: hypothetical protein ABJH06_12000 [Paraglaciecola sp.]|uniref:hypothetical protein n=1 Tax=Paraglaciecola sp. TaxID=1920173 RepID=UPI00329797CD
MSTLVAFIGWNLIITNSRMLADRNETYALLLSTISKSNSICQAGNEFWSTESYENTNTISASKVFANDIHILRTDLNLLSERKMQYDISNELYKLRRSLTLDAERPDKVQDSIRAIKLEDLTEAATSLKTKLYLAHMKKYKLTD